MKSLRLRIWIVAFLMLVLMGASGCSFNLDVEDILSKFITATITPTPGSPPPPTPTKTMVTFTTFTPSPTMGKQTLAAIQPTAIPTMHPSWTPQPSRTARPTWTTSPTWTPSPTIPPSPTSPVVPLINEYFSDPEAPWLNSSGDNWSMEIQDGWYVMSITDRNVEIGSSRTWLVMDEVRIEADVMLKEGDGYYGFSCRETESNYYTLFITPDGNYGFGLTRNNKVSILSSGYSSAIWQGSGRINHIRADCRGNALTLYVNNQFVAREEVEGIGPGFAGMMIGTREDQVPDNILVRFDNLRVWGLSSWELDAVEKTEEADD